MIIHFENKDIMLSEWVICERDFKTKLHETDYVRYVKTEEYTPRNSHFCYIDCSRKPFMVQFSGVLFNLNDIYRKMYGSSEINTITHQSAKNHIDNFLSNKLKLVTFI